MDIVDEDAVLEENPDCEDASTVPGDTLQRVVRTCPAGGSRVFADRPPRSAVVSASHSLGAEDRSSVYADRSSAPQAAVPANAESPTAGNACGDPIPGDLGDDEYAPKSWEEFFDTSEDLYLDEVDGTFRVYVSGDIAEAECIVVCLHGGGHGALVWSYMTVSVREALSNVTEKISPKLAIVCYDARGHGHTKTANEQNLSAAQQVDDCVALISTLINRCEQPPKVVLLGHSMGGGIAVRVVHSRRLSQVAGVSVIDVVEGTALAALPHMEAHLRARPKSFESIASAIKYTVRASQVKNLDSARVSVPPQVVFDRKSERYMWRTDLEASRQFWKSWFEGLSVDFVSSPVAKLLILAGVDRLDRELTLAQMQGKFQTILLRDAGHCIHEDQPSRTGQTLLDFLQRNLILKGRSKTPVLFRQRPPASPSC